MNFNCCYTIMSSDSGVISGFVSACIAIDDLSAFADFSSRKTLAGMPVFDARPVPCVW